MKFIPSPNLYPPPAKSPSLPSPPRDVTSSSATICYYPNGSPALADIPCNESSTEVDPERAPTFCCPATHVCSANGLCFHNGQPSRSSCTDPTWSSPSCPNICTTEEHNANTSIPLGLCDVRTDETVYCCGDSAQPGQKCDCDSKRSSLVTLGMYASMSRDNLDEAAAAASASYEMASAASLGSVSAIFTPSAYTPTPLSLSFNVKAATPPSTPAPPHVTATNITSSDNVLSTDYEAAYVKTNSIFSPALPSDLKHLYTALIVMGFIWLASVTSLFLLVLTLKLKHAYHERSAKRHRNRYSGSSGSAASADSGPGSASFDRGSAGAWSELRSSVAGMEGWRRGNSGTLHVDGAGGVWGSRRSSLRRGSEGSLAVVIEEKEDGKETVEGEEKEAKKREGGRKGMKTIE